MLNTLIKGAKAAKRFAGSKPVLDFIRPALANDKGVIDAMSVAGRFAPDIAFGALAATQTPGDAFDKGTAFLTSSLGGGLGGAAVTTATRSPPAKVDVMKDGYGEET